jgi:hypothetical protein
MSSEGLAKAVSVRGCLSSESNVRLLDSVSIFVKMAEEGDILMPSLNDIRESLALAESLASANLLTSPGAKRRLAARRLELGEDPSTGVYTPPKHLLLYLVR